MPLTEQSEHFDQLSSPLVAGRARSQPMVWLCASAVVLALAILSALIILLGARGLTHFWPKPLILLHATEAQPAGQLGEVLAREKTADGLGESILIHRGGEGFFASPIVWVDTRSIRDRTQPDDALRIERKSQGVLFGFAEENASPAGRELARFRLANGGVVSIPVDEIVNVVAPNALSLSGKVSWFVSSLGRFLSETPRRGNVQGGVLPAIVGTVVMVLIMTAIVSPLGVLAAIYLQEYAQRGPVTRLVRIAVNNLAGIPSIVYGVFGLGFFVYAVGGSLDAMFFSSRLPAPTLGTPGLLWASLTMALLTLPVVIVSTEEGLARVPRSLREGSLALGATRAETLWNVVLPAASPAILTGLILAIARATGEVAPLILVGVAKYAPSLPLSSEFPFLHLDRQFMHLGFYIYDLGFQSPHLETAEGLVFATAFLLVLIVLFLNLSAVLLRSRLRNAFKAEELR